MDESRIRNRSIINADRLVRNCCISLNFNASQHNASQFSERNQSMKIQFIPVDIVSLFYDAYGILSIMYGIYGIPMLTNTKRQIRFYF
jgi:hypothetical protein